LQDETVERITK